LESTRSKDKDHGTQQKQQTIIEIVISSAPVKELFKVFGIKSA
jgi:hypothetical protein